MKRLSYEHRGGDRPLIGETIPDYLGEVARGRPDREALVSLPQRIRWTYAELFKRADKLARGLLALGVEHGDRVGIWATDNAEWVLLQLATARVGAILVNINPANKTAEFEHAMQAAKVQTLFLMPAFRRSDYAGMVEAVCPEVRQQRADELSCRKLPALRNVVIYDPEDAEGTVAPAPGYLTWSEVLSRAENLSDEQLDDRTRELEADDPINIQFTSGTTGFPKPVVLTHHNILNNGFFVGESMGLTEEDRICIPVPFYHCFGMVISNLAGLSHGATLVIPAPHFDADAVLAAVDSERCTVLHGVPTMFVAELELLDKNGHDLSSLRTGVMAGAPCPPELLRRVIGDLGCREILIGYGQTEASPVTHITSRDDSFDHRTMTVGTTMPHQESKIVDPATGKIVPLGEPGEICFRGYQVMRGYYEQEDATGDVIDERGWLHSGDLGVMDEDGYVRITGRLKEMVIRGGENVYPAEIEAYLCRHPKVAQAAVFGIPHEKWGEELGAWIQLHHDVSADPEEFRQYVKEGMAHFKVPRHVKIVDEFPMTVTGKIQKFRIRELFQQELALRGA
ncbi:MAG: AMP-binding protein [bacterium]|nr:AMP-binding protein [bacterium]